MSDKAKSYTVETLRADLDRSCGPDGLSVPKLLATVRALEAERAAHEKAERERDEGLKVIHELRAKLAEAGIEGSPPPWETVIQRLTRERDEARARVAQLEEAGNELRDELNEACDDNDKNAIEALNQWRASMKGGLTDE